MIKQPIKNNHTVLLQCEYCNKRFCENIFKVTRQSQLISKLINGNDPISQYLEPKICCNCCFFNLKKETHYQILSNKNLKRFIPKL